MRILMRVNNGRINTVSLVFDKLKTSEHKADSYSLINDENSMSTQQKSVLLIGVTFLVFLCYQLASVLTPFLVAALLAYLTDPLVSRLQKLHIPRTGAVVLVFTGLVFVILLLVLMLIPSLQRQFNALVTKLPDLLNWLQQNGLPWLSQRLGLEETIDIKQMTTNLTQHWQQAGDVAAAVFKTVSQSGHTVLIWGMNLVLIPVVFFYLLRDWKQVLTEIRVLLPRSLEPLAMQLLRECNEVLSAFFRGQLVVMLVLGLIYAICLKFVGIDAALLIGIVAGLLSIVPYLGFISGFIITIIAAIVQYHDASHLLWVIGIFIGGHILEGMVLTPWLVGDKIGLHPVAVIFAILAGGQLFGFLGVLLALPVAAVIMVLIRYLKQQYITSQIYNKVLLGPKC